MDYAIAEMGKPVIVAVQDMAITNGTGIVASVDFALTAEGARFEIIRR